MRMNDYQQNDFNFVNMIKDSTVMIVEWRLQLEIQRGTGTEILRQGYRQKNHQFWSTLFTAYEGFHHHFRVFFAFLYFFSPIFIPPQNQGGASPHLNFREGRAMGHVNLRLTREWLQLATQPLLCALEQKLLLQHLKNIFI